LSLANPHRVRVSRHGRRLVRNMLKHVLTRQHAGVLTAQVNSIGHEVHSKDRDYGGSPPADAAGIAPGIRVRLGVEFRVLLRKLHDSRNLREQQALVREIRHRLLARIARAVKLRNMADKTRELAGRAGRATRNAGSRVWAWLRILASRTRARVTGRTPTRTVGGRKRAAVTTRARATRSTAARTRATPETPAASRVKKAAPTRATRT
jgi:hypothetical protein